MHALKNSDLPDYTYDDYALWEGRWELIDGVPYAMSPSPIIWHQSISNKISWQLENIFKNCEKCLALYAIDWKINENTVLCPDNIVTCNNPENEKYLTRAPEIIFEILSKSTAKIDQTTKYNIYEQEGVKYYVIVNGDEKVAKIYELKNGKYIKKLDASDETTTFDIKECGKVDFDFSQIWA